MKSCVGKCFIGSSVVRRVSAAGILMMVYAVSQAQDGVAGIQQANTDIRKYFSYGCDLMYGIGGVLGIIGAVRVYQKWSNGHPDTGSAAAAWFGACIFLVVVATVIKSFFGIQ